MRNFTGMKPLNIMLQPLLLLLMLTAISSDEDYIWRPQGRFGKRRGSSSELPFDFFPQLSTIRGKI